ACTITSAAPARRKPSAAIRPSATCSPVTRRRTWRCTRMSTTTSTTCTATWIARSIITMIIELLLLPLLAGLAVAAVAGPMGAFVVWRRMAFFGDTLAHGALLGAAFGLAFGLALYPAVVLCCLVLALTLVALQQQQIIASDTLLGIVA